jgi:hypothetical protein
LFFFHDLIIRSLYIYSLTFCIVIFADITLTNQKIIKNRSWTYGFGVAWFLKIYGSFIHMQYNGY